MCPFMGFRARDSMHMIRNAYRLSLKSKNRQYIKNFWLLIIVKITMPSEELLMFFLFCLFVLLVTLKTSAFSASL